ncbi:sulfate adenylyltransferase subunit 1 [Geothermobacter ehrlichii]|uniref:Sulfate adenylyltransferase subunit 1 n=1 Tax=Geothermobacter ehrlichii TaxID=213224 RepID=A0A5D3WI29_9BACT|nr:sulfate adenylyltransferase subunit CysN [Geothermobacter ehrlichii]TYO98535.1 sulfate adenylyltransferase subunit 1 [Geothermobacter ehrlichii]
MNSQSELIAEDIHAYLKEQEEKSLLRFITCGSVDDGKSTLIGRLLWDSKLIFEDQLAALQADSRRIGTQGDDIDYALLLDGLQAEREQGITIDVAYRFFSTDRRKFIVADTPGHEQYTRNMVTGASTAQVAVILVDARKGVLTQTRRHSYLVSLVGIRHVVLAVNKMDLVDYRQERFEQIRRDYELFAGNLGFDEIVAIPISALKGDNVLKARGNTEWYDGPSLMNYLETVQVEDETRKKPFRFAVQWVNRPNLDFRGFSGTVASGQIAVGDEVAVAASGQTSRVSRIVTMDGDLEQARAGQAVTLCLADEIDISRGDLLARPDEAPHVSDHMEAKLVWLHEQPLRIGAEYLLKSGNRTLPARVRQLRFRVNVNTLDQEEGGALALNEVGVARIELSGALGFDSYRENRATGSFILIDRLTNATVGAGMIHQPLSSTAGDGQPLRLTTTDRAFALGQQPLLMLFPDDRPETAGELAEMTESLLHRQGRHTILFDGHAFLRQSADLLANDVGPDPAALLPLALRPLLQAGLQVLVTGPADSLNRLARQPDILGAQDLAVVESKQLRLQRQDRSATSPLTTTDSGRRARQIVQALRSLFSMV